METHARRERQSSDFVSMSLQLLQACRFNQTKLLKEEHGQLPQSKERRMPQAKLLRRSQVACVHVFAILMVVPAIGQETQSGREKLHEPVYRVAKHPDPSKLESNTELPDPAKQAKESVTRQTASQSRSTAIGGIPHGEHPLDDALDIARKTLRYIDENVKDYTCTLVKRERINGTLLEHEFMTCKIRHPQPGDNPFSVYLGFVKPASMKGREVLFTGDSMTAHEGGFKGKFLPTVTLDPNSALAMRNQRYPITEIGLRTLTERLIEKGERDRAVGPCKVRILKGAKVRDRVCTCIEVKHDDRKPEFDFHVARIFVDDELQLPIRYEAFEWPTRPGGKMELIEEYTYMDVKLNVGLTDEDFNSKNPRYNF